MNVSTVVEGKVVVVGLVLPESTIVTVYTHDSIVHLSPHLQAELQAAIDEADREEDISAEELFGQLTKRR